MLLRLTPRRDDAAALAFDDVASGLDAGLSPTHLGGDATAGERVLHGLFARRRIRLEPTEDIVLAAAWRAGRAPIALRNMADRRRACAAFARTVLGGLRYPIVLTVVAVVTACVAGTAIGLRSLPLIVAGIAVAIAALVWFVLRGLGRGTAPWLSLPVVGPWARDLAELPYLEVLHGLYGAGIPLLAAHPQAVAACPVQALRDQLLLADRQLQQGRPLTEALAGAAVLHEETRHLLAMGEHTGGLEDALLRALTRRRAVAAQRTAALGRGLAAASYMLGVGIALYVIFSFYNGYLGRLGLIHH